MFPLDSGGVSTQAIQPGRPTTNGASSASGGRSSRYWLNLVVAVGAVTVGVVAILHFDGREPRRLTAFVLLSYGLAWGIWIPLVIAGPPGPSQVAFVGTSHRPLPDCSLPDLCSGRPRPLPLPQGRRLHRGDVWTSPDSC